nr:hypothetical protein [[Phormidium] sp. ETS-05]
MRMGLQDFFYVGADSVVESFQLGAIACEHNVFFGAELGSIETQVKADVTKRLPPLEKIAFGANF